jgi:cytoskeleton protein RodZ
MSQLGERLRQAREEQGISIAQAAADTRILQRYLVALEEGDYQHLPGDVYARGFVRNYAGYLGLFADEFIDLYRRERGATEQIRVVPTSRTRLAPGCALPSFFTVFFVVVALVLATYSYLSVSGLIGSTPVEEALAPTVGPPTPRPLPTSTPAPEPAAPAIGAAPSAVATTVIPGVPTPEPASPTPSPTQAAPVVVEVRIKDGDHEGSWLRVESDGGQVFQGTMAAGEAQIFQAQQRVAVRAGNAGVVEVSVNGQPPLTLGQYVGQVVDWSFPPN